MLKLGRMVSRSANVFAARLTPLTSSLLRPVSLNTPQLSFVRFSSGRPEKTAFEERALELLKGFEKIDASKLTLDAHFTKDLGLDSLDAVEVIMAIEDEFMIEIPDQEADSMQTTRDAVEYVYSRWTPQHNW